MKMNYLVLLACLLLSVPVFSQGVDIEWGKEQEMRRLTTLGDIVGEDANAYYVLKRNVIRDLSGREIYVKDDVKVFFEQYSMQHQLLNSRQLDFTIEKNKRCEFEGIYQLSDRFVMFLSRFDYKTDKQYLYAVYMDKDGTPGEVKIVDEQPAKRKSEEGYYSFIQSEDKAKLLMFRDAAFDYKSKEKFKYKMFTPSLEILWEKDIELPYKDKDFSILEYKIDEDGNVFLLGNYRLVRGDEFSQFKIFAYNYKKDLLEDIKVNFSNVRYISYLNFFYIGGKLHLTGFFNKEKKGGAAGVIYNRIDAKTFRIEVERSEEFSKANLSKFLSDRQVQKGKVISKHFRMKDIVIAEDGTITMIAEDEYIEYLTYGGNSIIGPQDYRYHLDDIAVVQLDKNGEIRWVTKIPKEQYCANRRYASYTLASDSKYNLYFLFNDDPLNVSENKNPDGPERISLNGGASNAVVMLATVDHAGNVKKEVFSEKKKYEKAVFVPSNYARLKNGKIWVASSRGKMYKYGFLTTK